MSEDYYHIKIGENQPKVYVMDKDCDCADFERPIFQGGESCVFPKKGCDWMCVLGTRKIWDNEEIFPIYAEITDFEEIGEGHWENQDGERVCKDESCILDKNGDFVRDLDDEDEVEWIEDDEWASYPYLVEAVKKYAKENDIDISHIKF